MLVVAVELLDRYLPVQRRRAVSALTLKARQMPSYLRVSLRVARLWAEMGYNGREYLGFGLANTISGTFAAGTTSPQLTLHEFSIFYGFFYRQNASR